MEGEKESILLCRRRANGESVNIKEGDRVEVVQGDVDIYIIQSRGQAKKERG